MRLHQIVSITFIGAMMATPVFAQHGNAARYGWTKDNTAGWTLMTAQERAEFQTKMRAVKTYEECKTLQDERHQAMEARANERGINLRSPRKNGCDVMKARGILK